MTAERLITPNPYDLMRALTAGVGSTILHPGPTGPDNCEPGGPPFTLERIMAGGEGVTLVITREGSERRQHVRLDIVGAGAFWPGREPLAN